MGAPIPGPGDWLRSRGFCRPAVELTRSEADPGGAALSLEFTPRGRRGGRAGGRGRRGAAPGSRGRSG
jgi:hypothetical protein